MATTIIRPKDRAEWLEYRKSGIGSSEVATIVGLNPFETPYQLWARKVGITPPKEENFAMKAGHYLEDAVSQFWADETGKEIIKRSATDFIISSADRPYMQVSPDRTYWLEGKKNATNKGILECKTTQKTIDPANIPPHWFCQLQYQLGVSELREGSLAWLSSGREFGYVMIDFSPSFFEYIVQEVTRFWVDCIINSTEPAPINATDVLLKYSRHTGGKAVTADDTIFAAYTELKQLKAQKKQIEQQCTTLEDAIKIKMEDAETLIYNGKTIATWRNNKDTAKFDTATFTAEHPSLAAEYTKTIQGTRIFRLS